MTRLLTLGPTLGDFTKGGGPEKCLAVSAGQPAGHARLPAAPRSGTRTLLPGGERTKPDWIHAQLQQHAAKMHSGLTKPPISMCSNYADALHKYCRALGLLFFISVVPLQCAYITILQA